MKRIDLTGRKLKFGRLTVMEAVGRDSWGKTLWRCECSCGGESVRTGSAFRSKTPCCLRCAHEIQAAGKTTHGGSAGGKREGLHRTWLHMRQRCVNPRDSAYRWYGAKGVSVCPEWDDYATFRAGAIGAGWRDIRGVTRGDRLSIDRIDPAGDYSPENCRFIPCRENSRRALQRTAVCA